MTQRDLLTQSGHAYYEAWMLRDITARFAGEAVRNPKEWNPQFSDNLLLESFGVHVRTLEDFFWPPPKPKPHDCFAREFFRPGEWEKLCGRRPRGIPRVRVNKEIAHLTYSRETDPKKKEWEPVPIYNLLLPALKLFAARHTPRHSHWGTLNLDLPNPFPGRAFAVASTGSTGATGTAISIPLTKVELL